MLTVVVCVVMAGGVGLALVGPARARQPAVDPGTYLRSLEGDGPADAFADELDTPFINRVVRPLGAALAGALGSATPVAHLDRIRQQLAVAGLSGSVRAEDFFVIQVVSAAGGLLLGGLYAGLGHGSSHLRLLVLVLCTAVGVLAPQSWLNRKVQERKQAIFLDLPDVLDLLAISVEAGVGFEGALEIVCSHFASPLATEFSRTLKEMELGLPRREALQNLKKRTEVPELSNFVLALVQADALGMPIGRVLHTQAAEMRLRRRQYARERAAKLPVKILFPLVFFIFPAVLIVILGPAATSIDKAFH